jgi:hypothetical protein
VKLLLAFLLAVCASTASAAFRSDGSSARAWGYPVSTNLNLTNDITISCWIIKEAGIGNAAEYVNKGRSDDGNATNYALRDDSAGGLEFYWANPSASFQGFKSVTKCTQTNTPIHIAITHKFGTTNNTMFWINGVRANVQPSFGTPQSKLSITNAGSIAFMGIVSGQHVRGTMLECAIWDVRLTFEEIASLAKAPQYNMGYFKGPRPQSLRGYWTFHEVPAWQTVTGQAWRDYSGWNCHLTATNSPQSRPMIFGVP